LLSVQQKIATVARVIDWTSVARRLDGDGEFRVAARHWTATVRLDVGEDTRALRVEDGRVRSLDRAAKDAPCEVFVSAPAEVWERMLQPIPPPFYHDLLAASLHHGLQMNPDFLEFAAYYPALRRMLEVLREARSGA
jgi:hypothetical protein